MKKSIKIAFIVLGAIIILLALAYAGLFAYYKFINPSPSPIPFINSDCIPSADRGCAVPEDEGKKNVIKQPEVQALMEKHGKNNTHIKALDIDLIEDIEFIREIHPRFQEETGCIIVAEAGGEGFVYQQDKDLNIIYTIPLSEFLEQTKDVDYETMSTFYLSLH